MNQKFQVSIDFSISFETLGLEGGVKTKSRLLNCRDKLFETVKIFPTVETYFLPVSR
jgi:hypothetical protein